MAESIERIYKLTVDGTAAIRQLQNIEKATAGTNDKLASLGNAVKGGLAAFAIKETAGRAVSFLQDTAKAMDDLGDSSQKLGIAAQDLETFRLAAQFSGSDVDTVDTAIKKLSKTMADFDEGAKPAVEAFGKLGINPQGKDVAEVLTEISDAFADLPDDANKTAVAMELLGKSGSELIPMLNGGSTALQAFNQDLRDLGLALTDDDIANAQRLGDAMDKLHKQSEGIGRQFMTGLSPALAAIVEGFTQGSVAAEKWNYYGKQTGLFLKGLVEAAKGTGEAFVNMGKVGVAALQSLVTFDLSPMKAAWADFERFGADYQKRVAAIDDEAKRIEEDRTFEKIAKALSLPEYNDDKPKRAAAAITNTGKAAKSAGKEVDDYARVLKSLDTEYDSLLGKLESWNRIETLQSQLLRDGTKLTTDQTTALIARAAAIDELNRKLEEQTEIEAGFQNAVSAGEATTSGLESQAKAWKDVLDPMAQYQRNWETINKLADAGMLSESEAWAAFAKNGKDAADAAKRLADQADPMKQAWAAVGGTIQDALGQGLADVLLDSEKDIKDWVDSFLKQLSRIFLNKAFQSLLNMDWGGGGSGGGWLSALGSIVGGLFGGGRATGGDVMPNTIYQVGEKGPEWFVPNTAGTIIPNGATTSGGGVVTNTYITVNTDGSSTTTGDDIRLAKKLDNAVKQTLMNEMRPGGILAGVPQK